MIINDNLQVIFPSLSIKFLTDNSVRTIPSKPPNIQYLLAPYTILNSTGLLQYQYPIPIPVCNEVLH